MSIARIVYILGTETCERRDDYDYEMTEKVVEEELIINHCDTVDFKDGIFILKSGNKNTYFPANKVVYIEHA